METEKTPVSFILKTIFVRLNPAYPEDNDNDLPACVEIARFLSGQIKAVKRKDDPYFGNKVTDEDISALWEYLVGWISSSAFWSNMSLKSIARNIQTIWIQSDKNGKQAKSDAKLNERFIELFGK